MTLQHIRQDLRSIASKERALSNARFFKTGKGEHGEGDEFLGITVPDIRSIAKKYSSVSLNDIKILLHSKIHEERLTALLILVEEYTKCPKERKNIVDFYCNNTQYINNWDLVDLSADKILGRYLFEQKDTTLLKALSQSQHLWERRIAVIATFYFVKQNHYTTTIDIATQLLQDKHDLIHKAVGWMLREVGKRDQIVLEKFLQQYAKTMPRTMLRYAIEKFPQEKRKSYLFHKTL